MVQDAEDKRKLAKRKHTVSLSHDLHRQLKTRAIELRCMIADLVSDAVQAYLEEEEKR